jgi:signal transduction histidine kinase
LKFKFKSIKTKLLVWFGVFTIIVLALFNVTIYKFLEENTKLSIQNKLYNKASFINKNLLLGIPINELLKDQELANVDVAIVKDEKIIFHKGETNLSQFVSLVKKNESFFVFRQGINLNGLYILTMTNPFKGAILFYEHKIDEKIDNDLKDIKQILFVLEPILLFILIFMASKVIDKVLKSIKKITNTANEIYVSDLTKEIPKAKYSDEIQDLVNAFNKMLKRLKTGVDTLEQFNSDVSHELKTPLTVIRGEIEITLNKPRENEYYQNSLKVIENETKQIQLIVNNLLLLTKYNHDNIKQTFEIIDLDNCVITTLEKFSKQLKEKNIKVDINKLQPLQKEGNLTLLMSVFSNLIDNAIKYSLPNTTITISLFKEEEKINFTIQDQGVGIKSELLDKVTNRFYRADQSRNKRIKGFGLGLSIVKNSIDLHDGSFEIYSEQNKGTMVTVLL